MKSKGCIETSPHCYTMKRLPGCEYINPYNTAILRLCKPECDEVNQSVREAVSNLPSDASTKKHLCTIGNVFLTHRQLSAQ
jgi:hypothetical protein